IAYRLGIDSPQNFSKYFAQEFGLSPSDYRKNLMTPVAQTFIDDSEKIPENNYKRNYSKKYFFAGTGVVVFFIAALLFYVLKPGKAEEELLMPEFSGNSIAILPFKNLGPAKNAFFSDGLMQQIHSSLG